MVFWACAGLMTAGVLWMLWQPFRSVGATTKSGRRNEAEVYRDQLREIELDQARGLLDLDEAAAAKAEVGRRLLSSVHQDASPDTTAGLPVGTFGRKSRWKVAIAGSAVPLLAVSLYLSLGSWWMAGAPYQQDNAAERDRAGVEKLVLQVESRLREQPEDGRGWDVIAPVYLKLDRFEQARQAYANAIRLLGDSVKRLEGFAQSIVMSGNGVVTEEARLAYEKVLALEPKRTEPRFWLAFAKEQDGRLAEAAGEYRELIQAASPEAPWRASVERRLATLEARLSNEGAGNGKGPAPDSLAAISSLPSNEQAKMIEGMVESLAARLSADGRDLDGWQRLVRSYTVLGQKDKAAGALDRARKALGADPAALASLDAFARQLGLGS